MMVYVVLLFGMLKCNGSIVGEVYLPLLIKNFLKTQKLESNLVNVLSRNFYIPGVFQRPFDSRHELYKSTRC